MRCSKGHLITPANTHITRTGNTRCLICHTLWEYHRKAIRATQ